MIDFDPPLIEGRLVRRYKRFLADVQLGDDVVVAHCPNPGAMTTCATPGGRVWLEPPANAPRWRGAAPCHHSWEPRVATKLAWRWELAEVGGRGGVLVGVNTARANELVGAALAAGAIAELRADAAAGTVECEVNAGASRLDFCLRRGRRHRDHTWVEVKNATMDGGAGAAAFPDAVTTRGARHVDELRTLHRRGARAVLLFVVSRGGVDWVRLADEVDPAYAAAVSRAAAAGVEVLAYGTELSPARMALGGPLRVVL